MSKFGMSKFATKEERAHAMGFDAGRHGPNEVNCHFSAFATPEETRAWERGKELGEGIRESAIREGREDSAGNMKGLR